MGFLDVMLGNRPDMQLLPGTQTSIDETNAYKPRMSKPMKQLRNALVRGDDVSNMGLFSSLRQNEAADLSDIDSEAGYGASALYGAASGDNALQMRAMTDRAKENRRAQTGGQYVNALQGALGMTEQAYQNKQAAEQWKQNTLNGLRGQVYDRSRQGGGLLGSLVSGAAQVGAGFATKCWVVRAIYGDTDPRVAILRFYIFYGGWNGIIARTFASLYLRFGERVAKVVKRNRAVRATMRILFDYLLRRAERS